MKRALRWFDYITINIYWFALSTRAQLLSSLLLPLLVQQFVGEETKGSAVGVIRLWALMIAVLFQAFMGILSDRSTLRFGRRRPFILIGAIGEIIIVTFIGFTSNLEGFTGYAAIFALYLLSMCVSNTAQAAAQGLIPDLVPEARRGLASGVKAFLEVPVPVIFVSLVLGKMVAGGNFWGSIVILLVILAVSCAVSMFIPEEPITTPPYPADWKGFSRLLLMTAAFTLIILGLGWLTGLVMDWANTLSPEARLAVTLLAGLTGMTIAIGMGVGASLKLGLGSDMNAHPAFTWWVVNRLTFLVGSTNLASFVVFFMQERFPDLPKEKAAAPASTLIMFVGIFILLSSLPGGWLADRVGKKPLIALAGVLGAAGTALIIFTTDPLLMNIGGSIIGAGVGLFYASSWALGTSLVPKEQAARYLGLSNLAGAGAGAIGAYIGGPIGDSVGYLPLMSIFGLLFIISIAALVFIRPSSAQISGRSHA
ncbi:MAG TPA: MFS transporter [Anaerolineaceae bacterium]|nr:MFS transporter [Anaerolineaceae bacterium]HPN51426.1 MFS transporter [Anaerolineaceae bacterium]